MHFKKVFPFLTFKLIDFFQFFGFYLPFLQSRIENQVIHMLMCFLFSFKITIVSINLYNEHTMEKVLKFAKKSGLLAYIFLVLGFLY